MVDTLFGWSTYPPPPNTAKVTHPRSETRVFNKAVFLGREYVRVVGRLTSCKQIGINKLGGLQLSSTHGETIRAGKNLANFFWGKM